MFSRGGGASVVPQLQDLTLRSLKGVNICGQDKREKVFNAHLPMRYISQSIGNTMIKAWTIPTE